MREDMDKAVGSGGGRQLSSGDMHAQFNLGVCYERGEGVRKDTGQAWHGGGRPPSRDTRVRSRR
jgi:TPR repeat protein